MGQQQRHQFGVLVQLHGVLALVGKQSANVDGEVHFVGEAREEGQHQFVVVAWRREVRRQPVALAKIVCVRERQSDNCKRKSAEFEKKEFLLSVRKLKKTKSPANDAKSRQRLQHISTNKQMLSLARSSFQRRHSKKTMQEDMIGGKTEEVVFLKNHTLATVSRQCKNTT